MLPQSISNAACRVPTYSREQINDLKQPVDLREEIERDLGPGARAGRWRKYRSPFREDRKPSFGVTDGIFIDFGTGARGDILTWLTDYRGLSFREALTWLRERNGEQTRTFELQRTRPTPSPAHATNHMPPSVGWQRAAQHELEQAERYLWSKAGARALAYLHDTRGLDDETIRHFRLGYNPAWTRTTYRRSDTGKLAYLAPGFIIPWLLDGQLWALKVRCRVGNLADALSVKDDTIFDKDTGKRVATPKYLNLPDGNQAGALYNADALCPGKAILFVEGEFDVMLAWQYAREQIAAVTLGSAAYELPTHWRERLALAPLTLSALDNDEAGQKATGKLTSILGKQHRRVHLPVGKDLTEFVVDHQGDASAWVEQVLILQAGGEAYTPIGLPDAVRQAGLSFLTAAVVLVAELYHQAVQRELLAPGEPFTIQQLARCSDKLGWDVKASTISESLAMDKQAGEVFFEKLDPRTPQDSSVLEDSGSNNPKKAGRPAARYRAKPLQAVVDALLLHGYFRLTEKHYPVGGHTLAEVDAAWFTALGFEQPEAERLAERARECLAGLRTDFRAKTLLQREYNALRRDLQEVLEGSASSTPLPAGWNYAAPTQYRAAFLRGLVDACPDQRRSRRELAHSIGVSEASVSAYLDRAGLENVEQFEECPISGDLARQIKQAELRARGYARRLMSVCGQASRELAFSWQRLDEAEHWVKAEQDRGASVSVRLQVASVQRIVLREHAEDRPAGSPARQVAASQRGQSGPLSRRAVGDQIPPRRRFVGPTFDRAWVVEQLLLGGAHAYGHVYQPGRIYHGQTGEIIFTADTQPLQFVHWLLAQTGNLEQNLRGEVEPSNPTGSISTSLGGRVLGYSAASNSREYTLTLGYTDT